MNIEEYNYWLYAILTIIFSYILLKLFDSYFVVILFYFISCFYLSLYFLIPSFVDIRVNNKYKKDLEDYDCVINDCINKNCVRFDEESCNNEKYCKYNSSCIHDNSKCEDLKSNKQKLLEKKDKYKEEILKNLDYYKILGLDFKKHINYYLIILIITFFTYLFITIIIKGI